MHLQVFVYLQRLEEAKGAQSSAARHQAEGGVVEHLLVVVPAETQHKCDEFTAINNNTGLFSHLEKCVKLEENM